MLLFVCLCVCLFLLGIVGWCISDDGVVLFVTVDVAAAAVVVVVVVVAIYQWGGRLACVCLFVCLFVLLIDCLILYYLILSSSTKLDSPV